MVSIYGTTKKQLSRSKLFKSKLWLELKLTLALSSNSESLLILSRRISISDCRFSLSFWALVTWASTMPTFSFCFINSDSSLSLSSSARSNDV